MSALGFALLAAIFIIAIGVQAVLVAINNVTDAAPKDTSLKAIRRHAYNTASRRYSAVLPVNPYSEGTWQHDAWSTEYQQAVQLIDQMRGGRCDRHERLSHDRHRPRDHLYCDRRGETGLNKKNTRSGNGQEFD